MKFSVKTVSHVWFRSKSAIVQVSTLVVRVFLGRIFFFEQKWGYLQIMIIILIMRHKLIKMI